MFLFPFVTALPTAYMHTYVQLGGFHSRVASPCII